MKKVINNIISNSVKYMDKPNGHIDIRILDEVDAIRVEIEDNGKGIAQKDLQKIFERFYRTDASRNSAQGGSGIGLSIVKRSSRITVAMYGQQPKRVKAPVCILS